MGKKMFFIMVKSCCPQTDVHISVTALASGNKGILQREEKSDYIFFPIVSKCISFKIPHQNILQKRKEHLYMEPLKSSQERTQN